MKENDAAIFSRQNFLILLGALGCIFAVEIRNWSTPRQGAEILSCHDGDTCRAKLPGGLTLNVRFAGIDAPEVASFVHAQGQPLGAEAGEFLSQLIVGKNVEL